MEIKNNTTFMALSPHNGLSYKYIAPNSADGFTFVCFNSLTGDKTMWETGIGAKFINQGHGLLTWNMRGQANSPFSNGEIHEDNIVADAIRLLKKVEPQNPVFIGLSVGGLYAAKVHLGKESYPCLGLVLINTLREIGPRLSWINKSLVRLVETGGLDLLRDVYSPLLFGEKWQAQNRENFLKSYSYTPIKKNDGAWHLLKAGENTMWNVNWETINVPVFNITGLQDKIFRNDKIIAEMLTQFQNIKSIEYKDAGHMIPVEIPEQLAKDILKFIERL
ncbi:MAG: alpha/beta hydrolase [Pelagibacteraceae bacterium]|nr:alpha/beta hydrolase [Pelagibacteraceae bacterium]